MEKLGIILALALATGALLTAPSLAQSYGAPSWRDGYNVAPSIREFDYSANGG